MPKIDAHFCDRNTTKRKDTEGGADAVASDIKLGLLGIFGYLNTAYYHKIGCLFFI